MVVFLLGIIRLWPRLPLAESVSSSRSVTAAGGELLRLTLAGDGQFRLWLPLGEISPAMAEAMQLYEDRWFHWHPGVNPLALLRAGTTAAGGGRRMGGSTITMQLARRLYAIDSRSLSGKFQQMAAALWLEACYSKAEILEAYLNTAPFGGNIEGVGAASLIYLNKPASRLSVGEAVTLAVIPQNPRKRLRETAAGLTTADLAAARLRLAGAWAQRLSRSGVPGQPGRPGGAPAAPGRPAFPGASSDRLSATPESAAPGEGQSGPQGAIGVGAGSSGSTSNPALPRAWTMPRQCWWMCPP